MGRPFFPRCSELSKADCLHPWEAQKRPRIGWGRGQRIGAAEMPKSSVIPASSGLDTPGIDHYKPRTFRQAVSFHRSIGAPRVTIHETQTLPLTACVRTASA